MNIRAWADSLPKHFFAWGSVNAYPRNAERFCQVMDSVQGVTTPSNMLMLNLAAQCLEQGEAIDNDTMNDHDGDDRWSGPVWEENVARFGLTERATYIQGSVPEIWDA